jgi:glycosyltransferase involved in cell wall biosynthesis
MPQISIIIPIYKVEQYLRRCLDSVLLQTFFDFECILVDDASPDSCPAICDEYEKKDSRFKVIHKQNNEGLPKARKSGLDIAVADFVMHIDSDDWIEQNAIELLYKKQKETNADIVIGDYQEIYTNYTKKISYIPINYNNNITEWFILCEQKYLWGKLYRRILFINYIVPKTNIMEDVIVNIQIFLKLTNDRIQFIDQVIYNYNKCVENSLLSQMENKKYNSYMDNPKIQSIFWVKDYLKKTASEYNNETDSAFKYFFFICGVIPYLRKNNKITKEEIQFLYTNYYKNCIHLKLIKPYKRIIMPIFKFSLIIGRIYIFIYNIFFHLRSLLIILKVNIIRQQVKHENK